MTLYIRTDASFAARDAPEDREQAESRAKVTSELIAQLTKLGVLGPSSPRAANMPSMNLATGQPPMPMLAGPQTQGNLRPSAPPASAPQLQLPGPSAVDGQSPPPSSPPVPKQHMRRAEWKRQQWESERVENARTGLWNPFGKPGGGAPNSGLPSPTSGPEYPPLSYPPAGPSAQPVLYAPSGTLPAEPALPFAAPAPGAPQPQALVQIAPTTLPAAIRSTFIQGAMVPVVCYY